MVDSPVRLVSPCIQRAAAAEEEYQKGRVEAITVIQLAWRKGTMRAYLRARFEVQRNSPMF